MTQVVFLLLIGGVLFVVGCGCWTLSRRDTIDEATGYVLDLTALVGWCLAGGVWLATLFLYAQTLPVK